MKISFDVVKELVDTFPIGLYAKRRINMELSKDEENSCYSPMEDKIIVSYKMIEQGFESVSESCTIDIESLARSLVYHEVSHAIMTPNDLFIYTCGEKNTKILNIFEDERIETVLANFYLDVNFKKTVLLLNGGTITSPKSIDEGFYNLVRFRVCDKPEFIQRVNDIIVKYADINANYSRNYIDYSNGNRWNTIYKVRGYVDDVLKLYNDFVNAYKKSLPQTEEMQKYMSGMIKEGNNSANANGGMTSGKVSAKNGEETESTENENSGAMESSENNDTPTKQTSGQINNFKCFTSATNQFIDTSLTNTLETIISQFNKKNKGGSGITSYSGVFNPRNVSSENYRYFDRSLSVNGNNSFGTFHLNLFIDHSGSFAPNDKAVNTLIKSLIGIEKRNKNFTFDVIFVGHGFEETKTDKERMISSNGGNCLNYDEVRTTFLKHQKANTYNYNIILFDGDCGCMESTKTLMPFDKNNCTLLVEDSNRKYLKNFKSAKVKYLNTDYANNLAKEVVNALSIAFH